MLVGGLVYWLLMHRRSLRPLLGVIAGIWLATMAYMAAQYTNAWRTSETLWAYTVERTIKTNAYHSSFAYNNYGQTQLQAGEFRQAADLFSRAVAITASNIEAIQNYGDSVNAQVDDVQRAARHRGIAGAIRRCGTPETTRPPRSSPTLVTRTTKRSASPPK